MSIETLKQEEKESIINKITNLFDRAEALRAPWESHWQDCYDYSVPERSALGSYFTSGSKRNNQIYDATALNAADQLGASMLSELTPPWSSWFSLIPGPDLDEVQSEELAPLLEQSTQILQDHFDRSNLSVEIHQAFMDLVTAGTASMLVEEAAPGHFSALQFSAIPLNQLYVLEGDDGKLSISFRRMSLSDRQMINRFGEDHPALKGQFSGYQAAAGQGQSYYQILEAVLPTKGGFDYYVLLLDDGEPELLEKGRFESSPFVSFRWSKSPGEIYGRSPVMKALPDIKTANKVVELVLKNASIAITGIWQADDDGVLNPANIQLKPGTIIPKAVGSAGLKPLEMPGNFDVSQLVLEDLRARIKNALLADKLSPLEGRQMSATEVLERSSEVTRVLGATYGRLQSELLLPMIKRAYNILKRRGLIPNIPLDGRVATVRYTSPLAQSQNARELQNILTWAAQAGEFSGADPSIRIRYDKIAQYAAKTLGIPADFIETAVNTPQPLPSPVMIEEEERNL